MSEIVRYLELYKSTINLLTFLNMNIEKISADNAFRNDLNNALKKFVGQLSSLENVEATFHSRRENIDKAIRQIISDDGSRIVANIANLKILLTGLKQYIEAMKR